MSLRLMSVISSSRLQPKPENADKLLRQLLECVQECQKRYGGKTELATEYDSCVVSLCFTLEAVLLHGIKTNAQNSTLKQVSDIVANSLHLGGENPSFWPFIKKHLTKHEEERYYVLKHIWTDSGRGRAWVRSTLNERSLERYFHTFLSNQQLLQVYYEDYAILRDQEKSNMLPNMAAGIGSILFAINIDKPELNSGISPRIDNLKIKTEPIINAPISDKVKGKKKNKIARQFISFDDDDSSSVLSTSVPSTSSSSCSENIENQFSKTAKRVSMDVNRAMTLEASNSRQEFNAAIPETLTPVSQVGIGELTPVQTPQVRQQPNDSEDIPTDISAILSIVENKNEEELRKKQEKIDMLTMENQILKEQIQRYVDAMQLLQKNDEDAGKPELPADEHNYKHEAKMFEKKLVQVADMHAELMNFNVFLQQSLCQKDVLLERLKVELEAIRGPMPSNDFSEAGSCVNVWIPSAFLTGTGSTSHHVYQVFLRAGNDEWNIYRRYAQFYALHGDLKKLDPAVGAFDFPPKKSIGKKDSSLVEDRRKRFQVYLRRILAHWPELSHCNGRILLEQHLSFFRDEKDVDSKSKSILSPTNRGTNHNSYTGL